MTGTPDRLQAMLGTAWDLRVACTMRDGSLAGEATVTLSGPQIKAVVEIENLLHQISLRPDQVRKALDPRYIVVESKWGKR